MQIRLKLSTSEQWLNHTVLIIIQVQVHTSDIPIPAEKYYCWNHFQLMNDTKILLPDYNLPDFREPEHLNRQLTKL